MFEDSTFESTGRIRTRSRAWMIASCAFNGSILLALVLIPLFHPATLPSLALPFLMQTPPPPTAPPRPIAHLERTTLVHPQIENNTLYMPPTIPTHIYMAPEPEQTEGIDTASLGDSLGTGEGSVPGGSRNIFSTQERHPVMVRPAATGPVRLSGSVVEGLLIQKTVPEYPLIAKATHTQGTVVLQATISRQGTIENLRVTSGPLMLQQAAVDAVRTWRYRPYLLNGDPVEVETTVNVIFTLQQ
jgi:protein TonB